MSTQPIFSRSCCTEVNERHCQNNESSALSFFTFSLIHNKNIYGYDSVNILNFYNNINACFNKIIEHVASEPNEKKAGKNFAAFSQVCIITHALTHCVPKINQLLNSCIEKSNYRSWHIDPSQFSSRMTFETALLTNGFGDVIERKKVITDDDSEELENFILEKNGFIQF